MKEIRPSTWITLGILSLLIFVPAFFIDVDTLTPPDNRAFTPDPNSTYRPINPHAGNAPLPANKPAAPPGNQDASDDDAMN
ncbi:MAG: hypothetical protein K8I27_13105 [Planctomycetes bacterium]|nr:hypothetical protein [Planctomycetota bacterium]